MIRSYKRFLITSVMGSVECSLHPNILEDCGDDPVKLREEVVHEAWRQLWNSDAKRMLKNLCDELGVGVVKKRFSDNVTFREV